MSIYNNSYYVNRLIHKYYKTIIIAIVIVACVCISFFLGNDAKYDDTLKLDKGWEILYNGRIYKNENLPEFKFNMAKKGDIFELNKTIEKRDINVDDSITLALRIAIPFCRVKVSFNDKLAYDMSNKGEFYIGLPKDYIGTKVKIIYEVTRNNAFARFDSIKVIDQNKYANTIIRKNFEMITVSSAVFIFGSIILILCLCYLEKSLFTLRTLLIALLMMCTGGWIFSNNESYAILLGVNNHQIIMQYYTIYFGAPILLSLVATFLKSKNNKKIMNVLIVIQWTMAIGFTILNIIDDTRRSEYLIVIEVTAMLALIIGRSMICMDFSLLSLAEKKLLTSFVILAITMVIEVIRFLLTYVKGYAFEIGEEFLTGVVVFVVVLIKVFIFYGKDIIKKDVNSRKNLDDYNKDILTGVFDRGYFVNEIKDYEKKKQYTLVYFDLIGLKNINYLYGYTSGDRYIKIFSKKLEEFFKKDFITISRLSGDEFVIITDACMSKSYIKRNIKKMTHDVRLQCKRELDINVYFSYGYIISKRKKVVNIYDALSKVENFSNEKKKEYKVKARI